MVEVVPQPTEHDKPVNEPISKTLDGGQRAIFTFEPQQQTTPGFVVPILAMSKHPESAYLVWFDDQLVYGPAPVPPTDIDDLQVTFMPAYEFGEELEVWCENLSSATTREYVVQPVGYERVNEQPGGGS